MDCMDDVPIGPVLVLQNTSDYLQVIRQLYDELRKGMLVLVFNYQTHSDLSAKSPEFS